MNYKVVSQPLQGWLISNVIVSCVGNNNHTDIVFLNNRDYSEMGTVTIEEETFLSSIYDDLLILYHFNKYGYFKVNFNTKSQEFVESDLVPEFTWSSEVVLNLDRVTRIYKCLVMTNEVFVFEPKYPTSNQWFKSGILLYRNDEKENNWIKCLNPDGGSEKWKTEFSWQFVRLETYENLIVLEYHSYDKVRNDNGYEGERDWYNPNKFTIVLNGDTGKEIWRFANSYHQIDYKNEVVLIGNVNSRLTSGKIESLTVVELNIKNGNVQTEAEVVPVIERVPNFQFVDESSIYYTAYDGSFGKIDKSNGVILWEFDLIDEKGKKRKLSDWLLLGNGNLVLQAVPNHPNGDLTCIFNPEENLQYSRVKNGKRISSDYV